MNLRKELIGGVVSFVEAGTEFLDAATPLVVSKTVKPSAIIDPSPWYSLGKTIEVGFDTKTNSDTLTSFCPEICRYIEEEDILAVSDKIKFQVREHSEHVYRLLFGIAAKLPTDGTTAVVPYGEQVREIEGWLQMQGRSARDATNRTVFDVWVKLRLSAYPGWKKETTIPEFTAEVVATELNSQIFMEEI